MTGGNEGMGLYLARALLNNGANVWVGVRSEKRRAEFMKTLSEGPLAISKDAIARLKTPTLDLESLDSVRACAKEMKAAGALNVVLLNAAYVPAAQKCNDAGIEAGCVVNILSHYLLLRYLLPQVRQAGPKSRVIFTSSTLAFDNVNPDWYNLRPGHRLGQFDVYKLTKRADQQLVVEFARREAGKVGTVIGIHPGASATSIGRNMTGFMGVMMKIMKMMFIPATNAAASLAAGIVDPEPLANSGTYWSNLKLTPPPKPAFVTPEASAKTWAACVQMLGVPADGDLNPDDPVAFHAPPK